VLASHEKAKKKKYLAPCLAQQHHFTLFIVSADGLLGYEADAVVFKLDFTFAEITDTPYLVACGFMNNHISISILWAIHHCFQGWIPSGCMAEFSPSSMAEWCRFEPVPSLTSFSLLYFLSTCFFLAFAGFFLPSLLYKTPALSPTGSCSPASMFLPAALGPLQALLYLYSLHNFL